MSQTAAASAKSYKFLVDGQWLADGQPVEVRSPYDASLVGTTFRPQPQHLEAAVRAAVRAFEKTRRMAAYERQQILRLIARQVTARREELARLVALEAGKPMKAARAELERAAFTWNLAAEESTRIYGEWLPLDLQAAAAGRWGLVRRFPVGPVLSITPFNFPINLVGHKLGPAIAAGCTAVHKPAPQTPLSSLVLAEIIQEAGWPAGALNVLPLEGSDAEPLVRDDRLKVLSFTGSARVGWELKAKAGKKRVLLELGGNAGVIIHRDADLESAAERCVSGAFSYAGQSCISVQRILVEQSVFEPFLAAFLPKVQNLNVGDPLDDATDVGPMIRESEAARAASWVEEAVNGGARLLWGGKRQGAMFEPTVLTRTRPDMRVNCMEIFAPVATVEPYTAFDEALRLINNSPFGLQAGLFTHDAKLIFQAYEALDVGGLIVGDVPTFRIDHMPYGGVKDSGLGREGVRYAIEELTERKVLVMNLP
jgi:acyl-CoA reductase-like NAD-dependent aldehyde dehydrogenase